MRWIALGRDFKEIPGQLYPPLTCSQHALTEPLGPVVILRLDALAPYCNLSLCPCKQAVSCPCQVAASADGSGLLVFWFGLKVYLLAAATLDLG